MGGDVKVFDINSESAHTVNVSKDMLTVQSQSAFSTIKANCCAFRGKFMYEVSVYSMISYITHIITLCGKRSNCDRKESCRLASVRLSVNSRRTPALETRAIVTDWTAANSACGTCKPESDYFISTKSMLKLNVIPLINQIWSILAQRRRDWRVPRHGRRHY